MQDKRQEYKINWNYTQVQWTAESKIYKRNILIIYNSNKIETQMNIIKYNMYKNNTLKKKTLLKKVLGDLNQWRYILCWGITRLSIIKHNWPIDSTYPNQILGDVCINWWAIYNIYI